MLRTLLFHPLGPALILALGGLLVRFVSRARRPVPQGDPASRSIWPSLLAVLACLVALAVLLALPRLGAVRDSIGWTWQPLTVAGGMLRWRLEGWSWLATLLLTLLALAAVIVEAVEREDRARRLVAKSARTLWLAAAVACFVSSENLLTLATCWILVDLGLAARLQADEHAEPAGRAWSVLSLTALTVLLVLAMLGEANIRSPLASGGLYPLDLTLLWTAGLVRAGVYPLHGWLTGAGPAAASDRIALQLMAPTAGLWLLAQVSQLGEPRWLYQPAWVALGVLALLGTALAAWTAQERRIQWRWIVVNRASLMALAASVGQAAAPPSLAWVMSTFALAGALWVLGEVWGPRWVRRLLIWPAALALWGLPGTTGFLTRSALILLPDLAAGGPLFLLVMVAESLLVAALWQAVRDAERSEGDDHAVAPENPWLMRAAAIGLALASGLLIAPLLYWGLLPGRLATLVGLPADNSFPSLVWALAHARRSAWLSLAFSGVAGVALGMLSGRLFAAVRGWQRLTHFIVSLEWVYRGLAAGFGLVGAALRYFAVLGEGEGYLGWLALGALILWLLLRG